MNTCIESKVFQCKAIWCGECKRRHVNSEKEHSNRVNVFLWINTSWSFVKSIKMLPCTGEQRS